jgi:hypothetical protein
MNTPVTNQTSEDSGSTFWSIIGDAANIIGILTGGVQLVDWIVSFVTTGNIDSSDQVLQRIDVLEGALTHEIETVGDQIKAQIQDLNNFIKGETVTQLVTRAKTAESELHDSYVTADPSTRGALVAAADNDSTYVSEYVQLSPDLAYLAALTLGGTVRLDIIRVLDPQYRNDPVYKEEIANLIALLHNQINLIVTNVTNSHSVVSGRQVFFKEGNNGHGQAVWGYYMAHSSKGHVVAKFAYGPNWQYDTEDNPPPHYDTPAAATTAAQQAVSQGITDELNFLGVPKLQTILSGWEAFAG